METCERRELLAAITGTVFEDLTGNGISADDPTWSEPQVTLELYKDINDNGVLDDALFATTQTDPTTGEYSFDSLDDGGYFLRQLPPDGTAQTAGPDVYSFSVINDTVLSSSGLFIDDFINDPDPVQSYFINAFDPDPTLLKALGPGILGGQRDMLVDIIGSANPLSASGEIGDGSYEFASAIPGTMVTLQYDGIDTDVPGPPAALINARNLTPTDLTAGGENTGFRIDFVSLQVGGPVDQMDVSVYVTDSSGDLAQFVGTTAENPDPYSLFIDFEDFATTEGFSFTDVDSVEVVLNENGVQDVDFEITAIVADKQPDYADVWLSSLSGYTYVDSNNNGIIDPGEKLLENTTVSLYGIDNLGTYIYWETTTDADGLYLFDDLMPGTYSITETQPWAYVDGRDTIGTPGGDTANDVFYNIELPADYDGTENNFGELRLIDELFSKRAFIWPYGSWMDYDGSATPNGGCGDPYGGTMGTMGGEPGVFDGTQGDDLFEFNATTGSIKLNGEVLQYDLQDGPVHFDGFGGSDTVVLIGTGGQETIVLGDDYAQLVGDDWSVSTVNIEQTTIDALDGDDTADVYDSPGDDTAWTRLGKIGITGTGFQHTAVNIETIHVHATAGHDIAKMYDSSGDDLYVAATGYAQLSGNGFLSVLTGFDAVHAFATAGGNDTAKFYDSVGDDTFYATPVEAALYNAEQYYRAKYFDAVHAFATAGGHDRAVLFDSVGDDTFYATPVEAAMYNGSFYNRAKFFEDVQANATAGGYDKAYLFDSASNDHLEAADGWAQLSYGAKMALASNFDWVKAISSSGGNDTKHVGAIDFTLLADGPWVDI